MSNEPNKPTEELTEKELEGINGGGITLPTPQQPPAHEHDKVITSAGCISVPG